MSRGLAVGGPLVERQETGVTDLRAREVLTSAVPDGLLQVVLEGPAFETGLNLENSAVTLGPRSDPALYRGAVTAVGSSGYTLELTAPGRPPLELALTVTPSGSTAWSGLLSTRLSGS